MNNGHRLQIRKGFWLTTLAALATFSSTLFGQEPKSEAMLRQFWTEATMISLLPDDELATYRSHSGGGVGPNGTLDFGVSGVGDTPRRFNVTIVGKLKAHRFSAHVIVKPDDEDTRTRAQEIDYDLSDLNPRSLEIARDQNGRVYRLSLVPKIIEHPQPKQFKASDMRLENWSFPSSPVIVNDQDYIGRLSMSNGPLAFCDIPGLAKIEFSLLHLKNALPIGSLENGVIDIAHESGTTMRISDVRNGINEELLTGGPYRVWVRWNKPSQSVEEYREALKQHIASLKERVKNGELSPPPGSLERLEKMGQSDRIVLYENGVGGVEKDDLVKPAE
jgi:hypothetical protein